MSFVNFAGLFFLFAIPVIILLYLLKLKRKRFVISSILLWQRSIEDLIANAPFQKLRSNIFLFLQILIALLIIAAIARPILLSQSFEARQIVLVIDSSASMKALDKDGKSRLDNAKKQAIDVVEHLKSKDTLMLMAFDNTAHVLQGFTEDKKLLQSRINSLSATDRNSNLAESLSIVSSVYKNNENIEFLLLSDGKVESLEDFDLPLPEIEYVKVGDSDNNVGFTQFSIRRNFESPYDFEIFANVTNFSQTALNSSVELFIDDVPADIKRVQVDSSQSQAVIFNVTSTEQKRVSLKLDVDDALAEDNVLFGVLPEYSKIEILLITNGNYFLQRAIRTNRNYELTVKQPEKRDADSTEDGGDSAEAEVATVVEETESESVSNGGIAETGDNEEADLEAQPTTGVNPADFDVVIYDNCLPASSFDTNAIYLNVPPPDGFVSFVGEVENPLIIDTNYQHPIIQFTKLENVIISKCRKMTVSEGVEVLAETHQGPVIAFRETDTNRSLVVGFDIYDTDFPLKASFPIFLNNAIQFLSGKYTDAQEFTFSTRDQIILSEDQTEKYVMKTPRGNLHIISFHSSPKSRFTDTKTVGFYVLHHDGVPIKYYGVNLVSSDESDIAPAETIDFGRKTVDAKTEIQHANIEIWRYFLWGALAILLFEWLLYWRKMTI